MKSEAERLYTITRRSPYDLKKIITDVIIQLLTHNAPILIVQIFATQKKAQGMIETTVVASCTYNCS